MAIIRKVNKTFEIGLYIATDPELLDYTGKKGDYGLPRNKPTQIVSDLNDKFPDLDSAFKYGDVTSFIGGNNPSSIKQKGYFDRDYYLRNERSQTAGRVPNRTEYRSNVSSSNSTTVTIQDMIANEVARAVAPLVEQVAYLQSFLGMNKKPKLRAVK